MLHKNFLRFSFAALLLAVLVVPAWAGMLTREDAGFYYQKACNFGGAWDLGYDGSSVTIGIIDDSMQMNHPYYSDRVQNTSRFWYYTKKDNVPTGATVVRTVQFSDGTYCLIENDNSNPLDSTDCHGTCVAGCTASYGTEYISINSSTADGFYGKAYGAAYQAKLVGMGTDLSNLALPYAYGSSQTASAQVVNNSYGIPGGFGTSYGLGFNDAYDPVNEIKALHKTVTENNTIMVFSAGNGRTGVVSGGSYANAKDSNKKAAQACPDSIVIAATGSGTYGEDYFDTYAYFSCYGSNVFASAPGGDYIVTSDRTDGGYTSKDYDERFNGTSASSPVATGVIALGVQALQGNSNVTTVTPRLIKHLLVQTCQKIDASATGDEAKWTTNAAGNSFSATYGFGQVDAEALVKAAATTLDVTPQTIVSADWALTTEDTIHSTTSTLTNASTTPDMIYVRGSGIFSTTGNTDFSIAGTNISLPEMELISVETTGVSTDTTTINNASVTLGTTTQNEASIYDGIVTMGNGTSEQIFTAWFDNTTLAGVDIQSLEEMTVTLLAESNYFGDLQLEVISPKGTSSILCFADQNENTGDATNSQLAWTFSSNAFWGEDPTGEWTVKVKDTQDHSGTVTDNGITVYGVNTTFYMGEIQKTSPSETPVPEPGTWVLLVLGSVGVFWLKRRATR